MVVNFNEVKRLIKFFANFKREKVIRLSRLSQHVPVFFEENSYAFDTAVRNRNDQFLEKSFTCTPMCCQNCYKAIELVCQATLKSADGKR